MRRVFEPVKIGNLELKNRLVRSATWEGIAQPDGSIFLESLYAKTEYNDDNYQRFIDYVANETSVDRERFISSFEIVSD